MSSSSSDIELHGWAAVPRSLSTLIANRPNAVPSKPILLEDIRVPNTPLVQQVMQYAKENLPTQTFNHSMRVFYFAKVIRIIHFPTFPVSSETLLLTALLHDIGTIPSNITSTRLSFEFHGGIIALDYLSSLHAEKSQAEAVCETIIRHQDLGETGMVTALTALIHFATVLDNAGLNAELVHEETVKSVVAAFPREGWTACFACVVRKEVELKPWSNTTRIEGFAEMVEANKVMEPYD